MGLDNMYYMTNRREYSIKITLEDTDGVVDEAIWDEFKIEDKVR